MTTHPRVWYQILNGICPTSCDDDCEAECHEAHQIPRKREHEDFECTRYLSRPHYGILKPIRYYDPEHVIQVADGRTVVKFELIETEMEQ